jgi:hypothetical protein
MSRLACGATARFTLTDPRLMPAEALVPDGKEGGAELLDGVLIGNLR